MYVQLNSDYIHTLF